MAQDILTSVKNIKETLKAMRGAGIDDETIIKRITNKDIPSQMKDVFLRAQESGMAGKAIDDLIALPVGERQLVSKGSLRPQGFLGKAAEITGVRALGQWGGAQLAKLDPGHRENIKVLKEQGYGEEAETLERGGTTTGEVIGSALSTLGTSLLPFAGKFLARGGIGQRVLKSGIAQAGLGASAALAEGGGMDELKGAAGFGAVLGAAIPLGGAVFRFAKNIVKGYPVNAYTKIFRNSVDDVAANFMSRATTGEVNPTLAEEVLNSAKTLGREVKGTADEMGTMLAQLRVELGAQLKPIANASTAKIPLGERRNLLSVLKAVRKGLNETLNPDEALQMGKIIKYINTVKPKTISTRQALDLKQLLDSARTTFKIGGHLNEKQKAFKRVADYFRSQLHDIPEMGNALDADRIAIRGFNEVVKEAVREGNQALVSRLEAIAVGAGIALEATSGIAVASGLMRAIRNPRVLTKSAQAVRKLTGALTKSRPIRTLGITSEGALYPNIRQAVSTAGRRTLTEFQKFLSQ